MWADMHPTIVSNMGSTELPMRGVWATVLLVHVCWRWILETIDWFKWDLEGWRVAEAMLLPRRLFSRHLLGKPSRCVGLDADKRCPFENTTNLLRLPSYQHQIGNLQTNARSSAYPDLGDKLLFFASDFGGTWYTVPYCTSKSSTPVKNSTILHHVVKDRFSAFNNCPFRIFCRELNAANCCCAAAGNWSWLLGVDGTIKCLPWRQLFRAGTSYCQL
jgi:hypothetical protein